MSVQSLPHSLSVRLALAMTISACVALGACSGPDEATPAADSEAASVADAATPEPGTTAATPSASLAETPAYAPAYPGAESTPSDAEPDTDLGGSVTFTTADSPEAVIDFYQSKAQTSGLSTVSALKQGQTQAYAAVDPEGRGATLRVVAAPTEDDADQTRVSVTWTVAQ